MSSTVSLKMPLICSSFLLSMLISTITLFPNGCNAGFPTAGGAPAVVNPVLTTNQNSQKPLAMPGGYTGNKSGKGHSSNSVNFGHGARNAGGMTVHSAGERVEAIPAANFSGSGTAGKSKNAPLTLAEKVEKEIKDRIKMPETIEKYLEKGGDLKEEYKNVIHEVVDILENMPKKLKEKRVKFVESVSRAQIIYDLFTVLAKNAKHQNEEENVKQLLAIFAMANDMKYNLNRKLEPAIQIVKSAINFYSLGHDPNAFDTIKTPHEPEVTDPKLKGKMQAQKEVMEAFLNWLEHTVQAEIVGKPGDKSGKFTQNEQKMAEKILTSVHAEGNPFGIVHKETAVNMENGNGGLHNGSHHHHHLGETAQGEKIEKKDQEPAVVSHSHSQYQQHSRNKHAGNENGNGTHQ